MPFRSRKVLGSRKVLVRPRQVLDALHVLPLDHDPVPPLRAESPALNALRAAAATRAPSASTRAASARVGGRFVFNAFAPSGDVIPAKGEMFYQSDR